MNATKKKKKVHIFTQLDDVVQEQTTMYIYILTHTPTHTHTHTHTRVQTQTIYRLLGLRTMILT